MLLGQSMAQLLEQWVPTAALTALPQPEQLLRILVWYSVVSVHYTRMQLCAGCALYSTE